MNNLFANFLQVAKNSAINMYGNSSGKEEKLRGQLHMCTYTDDTKFVIQKAVKQVFHVYPMFETDILSFKQANQQKRFIELKAILQIQVRGKMCKVDYNMMIPSAFPKKAPYVRIINRNSQFIVDDFYKPLQSPNDQKSYILNERLNEVKYWDQSKSIVNVIIESYDLMRNKFPFSKPNSQNSMYKQNQGWGNNSPWQQFNNNNQQNFYNNNQGFNNYVNGGYNPQQPQQGFNMMGGGMGSGFNSNPNAMKPPIPFNANNVTQTIANGQKFVGQTKKILQQMKNQHSRSLQTVQTLDILRYSIQSQQNFLRKQNVQMNNFLSSNQQNQSTQNLVKLVQPKDQLSQQILDLISSIKSRQDCSAELEAKFNDGEIPLEDFMRYVRKMEETKFQEKVLLAKCISVSMKY